MRIGINLLYLIPNVVGGTQTYATSLMSALAAIDRENDYLVFVNQEAANLPIEGGPNFRRIVCGVRGGRRSVRYAWEQTVLPFKLFSYGLDVVHSLGYVGPILCPCPHVVTIPDLNYLRDHGMSTVRRATLRVFVGRVAATAEHILTISDSSRDEIVARLEVPPARITVTHLAGRVQNRAPIDANRSSIGERYGVRAPYVVAFSSASPHKNIPRLVAAFSRVAPFVPHSLVLIGHVPSNGEVQRAIAQCGVSDRVVSTGYIADSDVMPLLGGAELFVFPSLYEGFGMPLLDAQSAGVPVACSRAGSLPEVAGQGAAFFDPGSIEEMSTIIRAHLADPQLRASLVRMGTANVRRFSWERTARQTLEVYKLVSGANPPARTVL
jgi:glycosyltransferase involved in cell wall biosynthesis